ncbi:hypothetical protein [Algibacter pectinivorans]|uniref:DUF4097 domain-containing protein n=1 Tax=Algibacter pectinivorans TaxID=870482 RepID=A0A1I1P1I4_9FLAO|nr:hypothetical protein [Algibacter pectinivorans]SFD03699.1 hypothetical protein SAMN04487987_10397 [Algibacter pectinivorans]
MNSFYIKIKFVVLCFLISGSIAAQQKLTKVSQSIKVDKDVVVDLNTSYCNIVFDTWNKNTVEIEAYIEGEKLSKDQLDDALKQWHIDIDATTNKVIINAGSGHAPNAMWAHHEAYDCDNCDDDYGVGAILNELKFELADMPEMHINIPEIPEMPEIPQMFEMPELPELPEGVNAVAFDYEAYKEQGEDYLEKWSRKFESKYGKDYAKKMEAWGEKFGKEWSDKYGDDFAEKMEAWGEKFGEEWGEKYAERMEEWGERFAERMEAQASRVEAQAEHIAANAERMAAQKERAMMHREMAKEHAKDRKAHLKERAVLIKERELEIEKLLDNKSAIKVKKTIKIKIPKDAKLRVNVKYGEIEFANNIDNLKADLAYTKFKALSINGSSTSINASYSPIQITHWNLGELNLNYVKSADIEHVAHLVLNLTSSEVDIESLTGSAIIDSNIGDVDIYNIEDSFNNLNIILQNSNAVIGLPKTDYSMQYKGTHSRLAQPDQAVKSNTSNFSTGNPSTGKTILINAKYSDITMQ